MENATHAIAATYELWGHAGNCGIIITESGTPIACDNAHSNRAAELLTEGSVAIVNLDRRGIVVSVERG
jgi:hypothetical protein